MKMYFTHRSRFASALSGAVALGVIIGITPSSLIRVAEAAEPMATLRVVTEVVNSHSGQNTPSDFIVTVTGASANPSTFVAGAVPQVINIAPDTDYAVTVSAGSRYVATRSGDCSGRVIGGATVTCNILLSDSQVFNSTTVSPNLIPNGDLEDAELVDASRPSGWSKGWDWGTNISTYSYPVVVDTNSLVSSGNAMSISYAAYTGDVLTGGDAKWYVAPTPVTAGHRYLYQDAYSANTPTYIVAEFFNAAHQHLANTGYNLVTPTALGAWKTASATFVAPVGAAYVSVYHQLNSTGTLTLDNLSLMEVELPKQFERGLVSLAFDDGYVSHYSNAKTILNSKGLKGTFYAISHISGLGILNPSLEIPDLLDAGKPMGWTTSGGADAVFAYPVSGHTGSAASFSATNPQNTDGLRFMPVTVFANQSHEFSHYYKSTAASSVYIEVIKTDGTIAYMQSDGGLVSTVTAYAVLPSTNEWTHYTTGGLWIPPASKSVSVRYGLAASGMVAIDDVSMGAYLDFMTPSQLLELQHDGHEIGGHTETHVNLTALPFDQALQEMSGSRLDLLAGGFTPVLSFAYPLGENNADIQESIGNAGYTSARGTVPGLNGKDANRYALASTMVMADTPLEEIQSLINEAVADRSWLILTFHHILPMDAVGRTAFTTTPERLESIVNYLTQHNIAVRTVAEVGALMDGGTVTPPPPPPATVTSGSTGGGGGSSSFSYWGCMNPAAGNYNRLANIDDNTCVLPETDTSATTTRAVEEPLQNEILTTDTTAVPVTEVGEVLGTAVHTHKFKVPLRRGSRGVDVTELQKRLSESGHFKGPITGYFGNLTFAAVKKFQITHNLDSIGFVGPKTRGVLNASGDSLVITSIGSGVSFERTTN